MTKNKTSCIRIHQQLLKHLSQLAEFKGVSKQAVLAELTKEDNLK